jgi:hypothetical protein
MIQERLQTAQLHQQRYADQRRRQIEYKVGDHVYLKVHPLKEQKYFKKRVSSLLAMLVHSGL